MLPFGAMSAETDAQFAEIIISSDFRDAVNSAFAADPDHYQDQRSAAEAILLESITTQPTIPEAMWEARRQSALTEAYGTDLGPFNDYIQNQGGTSAPAELTVDDLDRGKPEIVRTNSRITGLHTVIDDPVNFINAALETIDSQKRRGPGHVGPENYATALKYFTDKWIDFPTDHIDRDTVDDAVNRGIAGFLTVTKSDPPNFVEMTNVYYTIGLLPPETVGQNHTNGLLTNSLDQLPTFNRQTLGIILGALSKLDLSESGETSGDLVDLTFRKSGSFETTRDMRRGLRAVDNLPPSPATDRSFGTFLEIRNQLEQPLDIEGADEVTSRLLHIVSEVTESPELTDEARELAKSCAVRALQLARQLKNEGGLTKEQFDQLQVTITRIGSNYTQI